MKLRTSEERKKICSESSVPKLFTLVCRSAKRTKIIQNKFVHFNSVCFNSGNWQTALNKKMLVNFFECSIHSLCTQLKNQSEASKGVNCPITNWPKARLSYRKKKKFLWFLCTKKNKLDRLQGNPKIIYTSLANLILN